MKLAEGVEDLWPLVARSAELEYLSRLLSSDVGGVLLAGSAGVGKSRLGAELLSVAASSGFVPLRVAATQSLAGLPFGAFAHLIPGAISGADKSLMLGQIAEAVEQQGQGRRVALLVDDAHLLDDASAALTQLLATARKAYILATVRSGEPAPDSVIALWKDGITVRLDLEPLTPAQIKELLEAVLGGAVDGVTVYRFVERTRGNVLFLRELLRGALARGALSREEGVWRLRGSLPASSRVTEIIEGRLQSLHDLSRRTLEVLAVGEPLELELLRAIENGGELESLERRGFLRVEKDGRRLVAHLPHPLYGEVLREQLSTLAAIRSAAALADHLKQAGARRRQDTLRLATWALNGGVAVEPELMVAAATLARRRYDFPLAERLARAACDGGGGFEAGLLLAQACWLQGRGQEALLQLDALQEQAGGERELALLATARIGVLDWSLKRVADRIRK